MKRIIVILATALLIALPVVKVLAAPSSIEFLNPNPQDTYIVLSWLPSNATITVVTYRTDTYPANPNDGIVTFNGTGTQATVDGLTAGTMYYFSGWGFDGVNYSPVAAHTEMGTLAGALPTGGEPAPENLIPTPGVPAGASANASISGFNLEPFTSIIAYFDQAPQGGLGMPINNAWETITTLIIVIAGLVMYRGSKNFAVGWGVVFVLSCFAVGLHLQQWYLLPIEIVVGLGVWALDRFFQ